MVLRKRELSQILFKTRKVFFFDTHGLGYSLFHLLRRAPCFYNGRGLHFVTFRPVWLEWHQLQLA
jgi:hypothetical protein